MKKKYDTTSWTDRRRFAEAICMFIEEHFCDQEGPYQIAVDNDMNIFETDNFEKSAENVFVIETVMDDTIDACQKIADKWFDIR